MGGGFRGRSKACPMRRSVLLRSIGALWCQGTLQGWLCRRGDLGESRHTNVLLDLMILARISSNTHLAFLHVGASLGVEGSATGECAA